MCPCDRVSGVWLFMLEQIKGVWVCVGWRALRAHASQMVWYRLAWLALSRYMYVNTLRRVV